MSRYGKECAPAFAERTGDIARLEQRFSPEAIRQRRLRRSKAALWLVWTGVLGGAKRLLDVVVSGFLILLLSPVLLALHIRNARAGGTVLRSRRLGLWGCTFDQYSFSSGPLRSLPALINVWKGEMSFIGPRPAEPGEVQASDRLAWRRFNVRPGLFCLWWIRSRANIAYGTEVSADAEYVENQTLLGDLGIALRAIPASLYGEGAAVAPTYIDLLGVPIDNLSMEEAVESILQKAEGTEPRQVCFVNADCVNIAFRDAEYARILNECGLVLADGIGIKLAGKILNRNIRQNVNGTDMLPLLCRALESNQLGIYLLGGQPGVAASVAEWIRRSFPSVRICGHRHGFFSVLEQPAVLSEIRDSGARIVLVAFGVPKQEKWIHEHLGETGANVVMGVGGLFDFYSGRIPRAPAWMREIGMEWLYRFWQEPRRMWRRYFVGNFVFLARVLRDRFRSPEIL
jgi:N-acetylglucosaminyldiphosphoundecaprenol N-acetyl-beta-D-mannosaminyltransferase